MSEDWSLPRESREFIPINVSVQQAPVSTFEVSIVGRSARPASWRPADTVGTKKGVLVGPGTNFVLAPGNYRVWVKIGGTTDVENPVLTAGELDVT
jgi:hypothetical protein